MTTARGSCFWVGSLLGSVWFLNSGRGNLSLLWASSGEESSQSTANVSAALTGIPFMFRHPVGIGPAARIGDLVCRARLNFVRMRRIEAAERARRAGPRDGAFVAIDAEIVPDLQVHRAVAERRAALH